MARTKASVGTKVASGKSSKARCSVVTPASSSSSSGSSDRAGRSGGGGGGNSVCHRETPKWQKPITNFFVCKDTSNRGSDSEEDSVAASSSKPKSRKPVIESDEEVEVEERPKNTVLEETIELEPLTGEDSHKIEEYYPKGPKGKGKGKKTKDKENIDSNVRRNSVKRDLEEITFGEESEHASKRVKVN